jgi:hypothetical protein
MNFNDDDEFRTSDERRADEGQRRHLAEPYRLDEQLDEQWALKRLAHTDSVGMVLVRGPG